MTSDQRIADLEYKIKQFDFIKLRSKGMANTFFDMYIAMIFELSELKNKTRKTSNQ